MPHRLIWLALAWLCAGDGLPGDCGGQIDLLHEKNGFIRAHIPAEINSRESTSDELDSVAPRRYGACSWTIEAPLSQTLRLKVVSIAEGSRLQVRFQHWEGDTGESALLSGNGTAELTWTVTRATGATQTLEVFFTGDSALPQEETHNGTETSAVLSTHSLTHTEPTASPTHTHTHSPTHTRSSPDPPHTPQSQALGHQTTPPAPVTQTPNATHPHTLSHTHTPTHPHTLSHTHTPTHPHSLSQTPNTIHPHTLSQPGLAQTHSHTDSNTHSLSESELDQRHITHTHTHIAPAHTHTHTHTLSPTSSHTSTHTQDSRARSASDTGGFHGDAPSHAEGRSHRSISHHRPGVTMETTSNWTGKRAVSKTVTPPSSTLGRDDITEPQPEDRTSQTPLVSSQDPGMSSRPSNQPGTTSRTQTTSAIHTPDMTNHTLNAESADSDQTKQYHSETDHTLTVHTGSKPHRHDPTVNSDPSFRVVTVAPRHSDLPAAGVTTLPSTHTSGTFRMRTQKYTHLSTEHTHTDLSQSDDSSPSPAHPTTPSLEVAPTHTHTNTHTHTQTHTQKNTHTNTHTPLTTPLDPATSSTHTSHPDTHTPAPDTHTPAPDTHTPAPDTRTPHPHTSQRQSDTHTPSPRPLTSSAAPDWTHRGRVFIEKDQPPLLKEESFQLLLQVLMEDCSLGEGSVEWLEPFLQRATGYQSHHLTWSSGCVLQSVVVFHTAAALSWMRGAESLLHEAGLAQALREGLIVQGVRVKNITVGGLQVSVCDWLLECRAGFECVSIGRNFTCRSACHAHFCHNHGICVHHRGQQPSCQCPVGEEFWYMGRRCDVRMTHQRLVGVCFAVVVAIAIAMALLCYLVIHRFKTLLIQAKVDQTRSSYRRFNHFDELSARYWSRSLAESGDSLDNPAFSRSDELLHLRARQRTCCYHDDTLSICSTWQGSAIQLNTIYGSQYGGDMSNYSMPDAVVDSGKASDLSVCSWPIEPIQWTPFPLLQQLHTQNTVRSSRPRSYCEGMELVDLERSWTA